MGIFRFKRFEVVNEKSAMKVNTDGVLLGASMTLKATDRYLLDIGTGTGTIALMAAQRLSGSDVSSDLPVERSISLNPCEADREVGRDTLTVRRIDAIDIDEASVSEASANFKASPWADSLRAFHYSLDDFASAEACGEKYDLIFSNPPYFEDSLNAPEERRNNARHTSTGLSYREIIGFAVGHLSEGGRLSLVLPAEAELPLCRYARMNGMHLFRILRVRTVPRKQPSRIIAEFSRSRCEAVKDEILTIQNEGKYTLEYLSLMRDFYLFA